MKSLLKFILTLSFISLIFLAIVGAMTGYQKGSGFLIKLSGKENYTDKIFNIITPAKYIGLVISLFVFACLFGILLWRFEYIYLKIQTVTKKFAHSFASIFKNALSTDLKYLLIIPLSASVYFAFTLPVSYDEAWTYLNFTSKGILLSISYYPAPNNHILHSILTNFTSLFRFFSPLFCMRISAVIVNFLFLAVSFSFFKKYYNEKFALKVSGICSVLFLTIYYSYMSRGYGLVCLFFVTALYASFNITEKGNKNIDWLWFSLSSVLGFYTMPSFLYPFFTLNVFILLCNNAVLKKQIISTCLTLIIVALLYLPVIIVNGISALINNPYVKPLPRKEVIQQLPLFLNNAIADITGINSIVILLLICLSVGFIFYKKEKKSILFILVFLIAPVIVLTLHSVIPFSRTFIYYNFILVFICLLPLYSILEKNKLKTSYLIILILLIQIAGVYNFSQQIKKYEAYNLESNQIIQKIIGNKNYMCDEDLFSMNLLFELKAGQYSQSNMQYFNAVPFNTDTIKGYDYIIIGKPFDKTQIRKPIYETHDYRVYQ